MWIVNTYKCVTYQRYNVSGAFSRNFLQPPVKRVDEVPVSGIEFVQLLGDGVGSAGCRWADPTTPEGSISVQWGLSLEQGIPEPL